MFSHDILKIGTLAARGNSNVIHFDSNWDYFFMIVVWYNLINDPHLILKKIYILSKMKN